MTAPTLNASERIAEIQRRIYSEPAAVLHLSQALLVDSLRAQDIATQVQASIFISITRNQLGERHDDCTLLLSALELCEKNDLKLLALQVMERLGRDRYTGGLYAESLAYWKQCIIACRALRHCGHAHVLALIGLGHVCSAYNQHLQAVEFHRAALHLLKLHPEPLLHIKAKLSLGWDLYNAGQSDDASLILQETAELSRQYHFGHYVTESLLHLGTIALKNHDLAQAEAYFEQCLDSMQETPSHWAECNLLGMLAEVRFLQGSPQMAREMIERGIRLAHQDGMRHIEAKLSAQAAGYCAALNDLNGIEYFGRQLDLLHENNTTSWSIPAIDLSNIRQYLPNT
ncbi:tetratricopeptide repeat protein [Chitinibacter fontanus]|uniref:Tetratricopeptide repeat protein n=1 Tax=Chitinibacter fontanus TaxID=1737446 RepID=A0A7D5ZFK2_9NEIS|nr:tetratricopeptide repeat protein [Chitinibacter fontanus]QLI81588.1 tetratricopeptide repeat protein [Chitinibacter fontanus]